MTKVRVNIAKLLKTSGHEQAGMFSNVQNFGSGWSVLFDHGDFLIISGLSVDGVARQGNVSRDVIT